MTTPAPTVRRKRPARPQFASSVLLLEAILVLFATLTAYGLAAARQTTFAAGTAWLVGGALIVVLAVLSRTVTRPGGYVAGSVAQVVVLAAGVVMPMMAVVGAVFVIMWVVALRLGGRIDRERAAWDAAHPGQVSA
jgi:hypothetical protein